MSDASEETDLAPIAVPPALPPPPLPLASAAVRDDDDDGAPASAAALLARVEAHLARADAETGANDDGALLGELAAELRRMAAAERAPAPRTPVGKAAHGASGTPRSLDLKAVAAAAAKAAARAQRTKARTAATGAGAAAAEAVELSGEQALVATRVARNQLARLDCALLQPLHAGALAGLLRDAPRAAALKHLSLAGVPLDVRGVEVVGACVASSKTISSLDLEQCNLRGAESVAPLVAALGDGGVLRTLNLSANTLLNSGTKALAKWSGARRLRELLLSHAHVASSGGAALARHVLSGGESELILLELGHNRLLDKGAAALADALPAASKLRALQLNNNRLTEATCKALGAALRARTAPLSLLDLSHNAKLGGAGAGAVALLAALTDGSGGCAVHELRLVGCGTPPANSALLPVASAVARVQALTRLDLYGARLGSPGVALLCDALNVASPPSSLRALGLRGNDIGSAGASHLAKLLAHSTCSLQYIDVAGNSLGADGVRALVAAATSATSGAAKSLESLDLSGNAIGDGGAGQLVPLLRNGALQRLTVALNNIGESGARAIAEALATRTSGDGLAALDLAWNVLGPSGATALAPALRGGHCLSELTLAGNELGDEGIHCFAEVACATTNSQLLVVDLSRNSIGSQGMSAVATLLTSVPLVSATLAQNDFAESDGAQKLAAALKSVRHLRRLDVRDNGLSASGTSLLCEAIQLNPVLDSVDLRGNAWTSRAVTALFDASARNADFSFAIA